MSDSIQRLLLLRQFPGFGDAELTELAALAENVNVSDLRPGTVVAPAGRVPALHLVLDGRIDYDGRIYGPRKLFGGLEVIAGRSIPSPAIATTRTRALQLAARDFENILEDNFSLLSSVRRTLARSLIATAPRVYMRPRLPYTVRSETLGLVDRLVLLRHQITFATGRIQALAALAQSTREVRWNPGELITRAGDIASSSYVIVDGTAHVRSIDRALGPNDAIGVVESLAESTYIATTEAVTPVRALECPSIALFDVIEDHTDLGLALVSRLASELLDSEALERPMAQAN